jgi:hypothetical protein
VICADDDQHEVAPAPSNISWYEGYYEQPPSKGRWQETGFMALLKTKSNNIVAGRVAIEQVREQHRLARSGHECDRSKGPVRISVYEAFV